MTTGNIARRQRAGRSRTKAPPHFLDLAARVGFTARGATYILIGLLALAIAVGRPAPEADRTGALQLVSEQPFGKVLLWLLVVGFGAMALWRLAQAGYGVDGRRHHGAAETVSLGRAAVYAVFCFGTLQFVRRDQLPASTDRQSQDFTTRAMAHSGGRVLVVAVGIVIIAIGGYMIRQGVTKKFLKDLNLSGASRKARDVVERLGTVGNVARGVVFAGIGVFMAAAAIRFDPQAAKGIDATLRTFARTPLGPWLLGAVAVGLAVFGVYSLAEARWHRKV